ncbi:type II toxin-antitoxin system HipA family toxin [Porticoccaceae bacterium]|nr:type II toxin-antitoxin system HipA family toxin [Porticoccaceae bacterium]MDA8788831.1 type II toxin-antitoxin system HipA family toxin [Porticoccaceae bacterium]
MMSSNVSTLNIFLYGELIGTITNVGNDRSLFALTQDYIEDNDRSTLSLGLKDSLGELITDFKPTQTKLLPFFSNLLPEDEMRRYLAERANVNPEREFFLLWVLGQDLTGAITIKPADGEELPPSISEPVDGGEEYKDGAMRFSLAGVQLKFSAVQHASGGLTIPASGMGGSWIVKLPSSKFEGVPENEFSMMELARKIGMDVPDTQLLNIGDIENIPDGIGRFGNSAFAIKRFDRIDGGGSVHIEDFAQVFGVYPHDKYKKASMRNIAEVIGIEGQEDDIAEFTRRLVFNTLIGNADMHLKNWSLIYNDKRSASIAPAYDFVSTIPYMPDKEAALKVSRSKKFADFTMDELSHLAAKARLPEKLVSDTASETVELFYEKWQSEKTNLALNSDAIKAIDKHLEDIPIAKKK